MTLQQRLIAALEARGSIRLPDRLKSCVKLSTPVVGQFYFVGSAGSLRTGATRVTSLPVRGAFKAKLLCVA